MSDTTGTGAVSEFTSASARRVISMRMRQALRCWRRIALVLALFNLASLFDNFIKWSHWINWAISHYQTARGWAFGWLPFRVPEDWRDIVVFFLVLLSITVGGVRSSMGRSYLSWLLGTAIGAAICAAVDLLRSPFHFVDKLGLRFRGVYRLLDRVEAFGEHLKPDLISKRGLGEMIVLLVGTLMLLGVAGAIIVAGVDDYRLAPAIFLLSLWMASGGYFAWRWLLATTAAFVALLAVNWIYLLWLLPWGY